MRVLVTGHKGYVGTIMVPMLMAAGHDVVGLDSDLYEQCTFGNRAEIQNIPDLEKDIRDVEALGGNAGLCLAAALEFL
jgi:nucleoside-diphosphate-sugar epimerase